MAFAGGVTEPENKQDHFSVPPQIVCWNDMYSGVAPEKGHFDTQEWLDP
jgi:hypothetical protein